MKPIGITGLLGAGRTELALMLFGFKKKIVVKFMLKARRQDFFQIVMVLPTYHKTGCFWGLINFNTLALTR